MILKKTSLKGKLLIIILFTSFICVMLTSVAITYSGIYNIKHRMIVDTNVTARLVSDRIATFIRYATEDVSEINEYLEFISSGDKRLESITRVCVYRTDILDNTVLLTSKIKPGSGKQKCPSVEEMNEHMDEVGFSGNYLTAYREIKYKNQDVVGHLFIESNLSEIQNFIRVQMLTAAVVIMAVSLLSYFLATFMQRSISKPILTLVDTTRKVSESKDYSIRAHNFLEGEDINRNEISILIGAFNSMLEEVEERRQMLLKKNQELVKARDLAESANRAKSQFLANISHELRTPLNAVIGFSDIIMREMLGIIENKKYLEYAKDINDSGEHLLHIINDILDLSKAEAGKMEPVFREISVKKTVEECLAVIAERAAQASISLQTEIPLGLPSMVADRVMFKRILMHLLSNAVKFTNKGGTITVLAEMAKDATDPDTDIFTITVRDTGIGMSNSDVELGFSSFVQLDGGFNRKYDGTGLGLPLSKKFMELHGGKIRLESNIGVGTSAILTFFSKR